MFFANLRLASLLPNPIRMTSNALPSTLYESLLAKLATVLDLVQASEGVDTPQAKQALFQAVGCHTC